MAARAENDWLGEGQAFQWQKEGSHQNRGHSRRILGQREGLPGPRPVAGLLPWGRWEFAASWGRQETEATTSDFRHSHLAR